MRPDWPISYAYVYSPAQSRRERTEQRIRRLIGLDEHDYIRAVIRVKDREDMPAVRSGERLKLISKADGTFSVE